MLKIQELRTNMGLTQKELAEKIGVKNYTVANWEQNRTKPSIKDLKDLADFFSCSIDYLVNRENDFGQIIVTNELTDKQAQILALYENLSPQDKDLIERLLYKFQKKSI